MKTWIISASMFVSLTTVALGNQINPGDRVNFDDLVGTALEVFSNGNVNVSFDGYYGYTIVKAKKLGVGVDCYNPIFSKKICVRDRVNSSDLVGTAVEVFSNGNASVSFDGYFDFTVIKASRLGRID